MDLYLNQALRWNISGLLQVFFFYVLYTHTAQVATLKLPFVTEVIQP